MEKKIVLNKEELVVESVYPFRYDYGKGKEVLRVEIYESKHNFDKVKVLENLDNQVIEYWEDGEKKNEYFGYCRDFSSNYIEGKFTIEVTRMSDSDRKIEELEKKLIDNTNVLNTLLLSELEA